jgi:hypothetical protein
MQTIETGALPMLKCERCGLTFTSDNYVGDSDLCWTCEKREDLPARFVR